MQNTWTVYVIKSNRVNQANLIIKYIVKRVIPTTAHQHNLPQLLHAHSIPEILINCGYV